MDPVYLAYLGPPLLGAFIGYLTNRIAIRMLFRPLRRWRVLGIPVPLTPGVIPSRRHELALNIGDMVGTHLLTSRDIGAALSEERFQLHLYSLIDARIDHLLSQDLGSLHSLVPERFQAYFQIAVRTLKHQFRMGIHRYLQSEEFETKLMQTMMVQLDSFSSKPFNDMVSREEREVFYRFVETLAGNLLAQEETEVWLAEYLQKNIDEAAAAGRKLGDYLPATLHDFIMESIERYAPEILQQLARMVSEPPVRERIIALVRGAADNFVSSLGFFGSLAGSFLDMDALEDRVRIYLTEHKEEIRQWLENPEVQERFRRVLSDQVVSYLDKPLAELVGSLDEEKKRAICCGVARQLLGIIRSPGVVNTLSRMLRENLEEMLEQGERSVAEVGEQLLGGETSENLRRMIAGETVALVRSRRVKNLLDKMMNAMVDRALDRPLGILNNLLPSGVRKAIADYAVLSVNRILLREVPGLVDSLEIRRIVTAKVDSLDLLKLERLLLSIMEEQFKYINLFGALLGFLIGLANLLFLQM